MTPYWTLTLKNGKWVKTIVKLRGKPLKAVRPWLSSD